MQESFFRKRPGSLGHASQDIFSSWARYLSYHRRGLIRSPYSDFTKRTMSPFGSTDHCFGNLTNTRESSPSSAWQNALLISNPLIKYDLAAASTSVTRLAACEIVGANTSAGRFRRCKFPRTTHRPLYAPERFRVYITTHGNTSSVLFSSSLPIGRHTFAASNCACSGFTDSRFPAQKLWLTDSRFPAQKFLFLA